MWMKFFVGGVSLFGFAAGIRISQVLLRRFLFDESEMTKIGTVYAALVLVVALQLPQSRFSMWFAVFAPLGVMLIYVAAIMTRRARLFRTSILESMTLISLKMKGGRSFRQAISEVAAESEPKMRAKLTEIVSAVVFSQQTSDASMPQRTRDIAPASAFLANAFVRDVILELKRVDSQPHAAARRLNVYRDKLRIEDDFRRRSGQVLARIRAQSLIMTGLYFALAIFMGIKFGWRGNQKLFVISAVLFAVGTLWIWLSGRKIRWKV